MKCRERCGGVVLLKVENKIRKFICNKCNKEFFFLRRKSKNRYHKGRVEV